MIAALETGLFFFCLAGAAFFAACETALMSVSLSGWDRLRPQKPSVEATYHLWAGDPSLVMAALLLGNTLASLGASVVAGAYGRDLLAPTLSMVVFLLLLSFFAGGTILVVGEIIPKLYARRFPERVLLRASGLLAWVVPFFAPPLRGLTRAASAIRSALSLGPSEPLVTAEELRQALSDAQSEGIAPAARRILTNLVAFDKVQVRDVMVPRSQVIAVRMEQNTERMFEYIVRSGFSRLPIYFGNIDNILGIVYAKDLLAEWRSSGLLILEDLLRPAHRIAPEAPLSTLLQGFRQGKHLVVVTDTFGRTQGIATIEDVVEAIVGDIADEYDQPRP
jgi:putative hemolysin